MAREDQKYIIDLCDQVLGMEALREHRFDFLRGDQNKKGTSVCLPVDAYYPASRLVIEYRERQHSEKLPFFDNKETISGVSRAEQRRLYDQRRRDILPKYGINLIEFDYSDFAYDSRRRLKRTASDETVVRSRLADYIAHK